MISRVPGQELVSKAQEWGFLPEFDIKKVRCAKEKCCGMCYVEDAGETTTFRCKKCGCRRTVMESLDEGERDSWLARIPLRKQLAVLHCFTRGKTVEQTADDTFLSVESVQAIWKKFVPFVSDHQETANASMEMGGDKHQLEADEVALRCTAVRLAGGSWGIAWIRYFGLVLRGSSKIFLSCSPEREVKGHGQGGGGALSIAELKKVLHAGSGSKRLRKGSILHTDSAKAYRRIGPVRWPEKGALHQNFEEEEDFKTMGYIHTNVIHKRKPGQPVRYTEYATVRTEAGTDIRVQKGTQTIDGYWATLRRCVEKRAVNTGPREGLKREWFHKPVRVHQ